MSQTQSRTPFHSVRYPSRAEYIDVGWVRSLPTLYIHDKQWESSPQPLATLMLKSLTPYPLGHVALWSDPWVDHCEDYRNQSMWRVVKISAFCLLANGESQLSNWMYSRALNQYYTLYKCIRLKAVQIYSEIMQILKCWTRSIFTEASYGILLTPQNIYTWSAVSLLPRIYTCDLQSLLTPQNTYTWSAVSLLPRIYTRDLQSLLTPQNIYTWSAVSLLLRIYPRDLQSPYSPEYIHMICSLLTPQNIYTWSEE